MFWLASCGLCDLRGLCLLGDPSVVKYPVFIVALQAVPRVFQTEFVNLFPFFFFSVSSQWSVEWAIFSKKRSNNKAFRKNIFFANQYKCMQLKIHHFKSELPDLPSVEALLSQLVGFSFHLVCWGKAKIGLYLRYFS